MPPKGSEVTKLPEFVARTGPDEVCCNACGNGIIKRRNLARHLETASHKDSFRVYEAQRRASAVDQLRQSNPVGLNPPLPSHSLMNPSPAASGSMPSDTWHLDTNGINTSDYSDIQFSAGESENLGLPLLMRSMGVNQATEVTRTPPEVEDDEFSMPLPQRILRSLAAEELNVEELQTRFAGLKQLAHWCPYESKIMFLLDLLDNIPRLRLSAEHLRLIMWVMEEAGCSDMPKFSRLRQVQQELRTVCAITSHQYRSSQGNFFEMLDIPQLIGRDFSNPLVAPHLVFYPEDSGNRLSESWQAKKWRDKVPLEHLTPMYADGGKTYYVNELARLHNGAYVIPRRWITREGQLTADCWPVNWQSVPGNEEETRLQVSEDIIHVPSNAFASNYYDLIEHMDAASYRFTGTLKDVRALAWHKYAHIERIGVASKSFEERMPNPLRKLAGNAEELVSCFIKPWCDDVSGGRTKQYQPHNNIYIMHANLPGSFLNQEFSVRFTSTATHASSTEQFEAIKEQLEANNKNPIRVYNAATGRYVHLRIYILNIPADNRAQSEVASHAGQPRTTEGTVHKIWEQINTACLGVETHVAGLQTNSGVKDATAQSIIIQLIERGRELRKQLKRPGQQVEDDLMIQEQSKWLQSQPSLPFNVLFQIHGLDPHRDTPVEILHTILLGVEKYAWHLFHSSTKADAHKKFETRLQSANISGLEMDPVRAGYIVRFKNNLIGRHFKALMQLTVFQVHDLVSADLFSLIKAVGDLGAVLWYSEIMDLELYLADLSILINNVLDAFTKLDPGRIIAKLKLHVLTHLIEDILNHGPAVRYSTEIFECYNGVFRMCSILSNHQAPSRDIAQKMIELERFRHIVCGGYWETSNGPACASVEVRRFFEASLKLQSHLGWVRDEKPEPGKITLHSSKQAQTLKWQDTIGGKAGIERMFFTERNWHVGESVKAANGDDCEVGSWIVATHSQATIIGRVQEILLDVDSGTHGLVTIDRFDVAEDRHSILGMPVLVQTNANICYTTVLSSYAIDFAVNVQHDCLTLHCPNSAIELICQERRNTTLERQTVEHREEAIFIINMHALHNARRIREVLPRRLTEPVPLRTAQDRQDFIATSSRQLHARQAVRREEIARKRKATREREAHNTEAQA